MNTTFECPGFAAAGIAAGIKKKGALDLGLIYSTVPATAAGVFTRNQVQAAPVLLCKDHLVGGTAQAVVANSGNANCYTGADGLDNAYTTAAEVAEGLKLSVNDVLVTSTGVIGVPLPMAKVQTAIPDLVAAVKPSGFSEFASAIMTTDTVPKLVKKQGHIDGRTFTILAIAKGAGMVRPDMATMLCFICTDAILTEKILQQALKGTVNRTLNRITIDGDTSTNDTALVLANGISGVSIAASTWWPLIWKPVMKAIFQLLWKHPAPSR